MILLVFVAAVAVAVALERQARRHRFHIAIEYERIGIPAPPPRPKLKRAEAWLNVGLGSLLCVMSLMSAKAGIEFMTLSDRMPDRTALLNQFVLQAVESGAFLLASGLALAWLGWRAVREITRYESGAARLTGTTGVDGEVSRDTPPPH